MSTRDERVVSLRFDNAQFERGAAQSMSTLDKLKEKLKFKDTEKDLDKLQKSVDSVTFDKIQKSLESLEKRFSVMGIAGMRVIENLVDKALSGLGKIEAATIGQIKSGGWARAMNLANAQFQIEGLGYSWEKVLEAVDYGVKNTAYGLDAAASAAAQLAASGVDFEKVIGQAGDTAVTAMHKALRAISGVAAMTNSSYEDISNVFTRVAGQGKVMATDLNSIAARGLNAAATLANYLHTTEADVRDLVGRGQISFAIFADAMDSAFGAHAKEANKTFNGALSNMKAALSRIGALFSGPIVNKTNTVFVAMTKQINNAKSALSDLKGEQNKILEERFESHFAQAWEAMTEAVVKFIDAINPDWFQKVADIFDRAAVRMRDFFISFDSVISDIKEKVEEAKESLIIPLEDAMAAFEIFFNGKYGNGQARVKALQNAGRDAKKVQTLINAWYKAGFDPAKLVVQIEGTNAEDLAEWLKEVAKNGYKLDKVQKKLGTSTSETAEVIEEEMTKEQELALTYYYLAGSLENLAQTVGNVFKIIGNVISGAWKSIKKTIDPLGTAEEIYGIITWFHDLSEEIKRLTDFSGLDKIEELSDLLESGAGNAQALNAQIQELLEENKDQKKVRDMFDSLARSIANVWRTMKNLGRAAFTIGRAIFRAFKAVFSPSGVASGIEEVTWTFANFSEGLVTFAEKVSPIVESAFYLIFSAVKAGITIVKDIIVSVTNFLSTLMGVDEVVTDVGQKAEGLTDGAKKAPDLIDRISEALMTMAGWIQAIPDFFRELFDLLNENDGVQRLKTAFSDLADSIGEVFGSVVPATESLDSVVGNQNERKSAAQVIADAIGWIADKLAAIVEWAPVALGAIKGLFEGATKAFKNFFGKAGDADGQSIAATDFENRMQTLYGIPATLRDSVDSTETEKTSDKIKTFFGNIANAIKSGFEGVHLEDIKNLAIVAGVLYSLWSMNSLIERVKSVPTNLGRMFYGLGSMFKNYGIAWREQIRWTMIIGFLESLVKSIIAITGWMVLLGQVPKDQITQGLSVMTIVTLLILALSKTMTKIASILSKKASKNYNQQFGIINHNIQGQIGALIGLGVLLAGLGAAIWLAFKSLQIIVDMNNFTSTIIKAGVVIAVMTGAVIGLMLVLSYCMKQVQQNELYKSVGEGYAHVGEKYQMDMGGKTTKKSTNPMAVALLSLSTVLIAISASVMILAVAMAIIENTRVSLKSAGIVAGILIVIAASISLMLLALGRSTMKGGMVKRAKSDVGSMLGLAAVLIAFAFALKIMMKSLMLLMVEGAALGLLTKGKGIGGMAVALGMFAVIIVAIGGAVALMAAQMSKMKGSAIWSIPVTLLALAGVVGAIAASIGILATLDVSALTTAAICVGALMGVMTLLMIALFGTGNSEALGDGYHTEKKRDFKTLLGMAAAIVAIGASMYALAKGLEVVSAIDGTKLKRSAIAIGVLMGVTGALIVILAKVKNGVKALQAFALAMVSIGAGMMLLGVGLALVNKTMPAFADGIDKLLSTIDRHRAAALIVVGALIALAATFAVLYKFCKPFLEALSGIVKAAGEMAKSLGSLIGEGLKTAGEFIIDKIKKYGPVVLNKLKEWGGKIRDWIFTLPAKIKALLTILMLSLGASMGSETGSGSLLGTVGKVLRKLLNWLKDGMPTFVGEILDLLLSAVDALAGGIKRRSSRFAAAFWVIVSTLLGLMSDIIAQGLGMLGLAVGDKLKDATTKMYVKAEYNSAKAEFDDIERLYKQGSVTLEEYNAAKEKLTETNKRFIEAMGKDINLLAFGTKNGVGYSNIQINYDDDIEHAMNLNAAAVHELFSGKYDEATLKGLKNYIKNSPVLRDMINYSDEAFDLIEKKLSNLGLSIPELGTKEGFDSLMKLAAFRDGLYQEVQRIRDSGGELTGALKEYWEGDYKADLDWLVSTFGDAIRTSEQYIDWRENYIKDTEEALNAQVEVQAKVLEVVYGIKSINDEFKSDLKETKKLYNESTDFAKRSNYMYESGAWGGGYKAGTEVFNLYGEDLKASSSIFRAWRLAEAEATIMREEFAHIGEVSAEDFVASFDTCSRAPEQVATLRKAGSDSSAEVTSGAEEQLKKDLDENNNDSIVSKGMNWLTNTLSSDKVRNTIHEGGKSITTGLTEGVLDSESLAEYKAAFETLGEEGIDTYKSTIHSNSPSKVFQRIGSYIVQGLSNGITDSTPLATDSSATLAQRTIDAFGNPLDYVSKVMSGELTYDPSIRPVMDMSSVSGSAASIQGMFRNQNVAVSGFSGKLAADIGQLQRDNQDVVDEIALLREDMADMTEKMSNLQVVMSNGALVGAIAPTMDSELGWRATRKGRGV